MSQDRLSRREHIHQKLDKLQAGADSETSDQVKHLLHEVQVYQIELEMQNQQLLEAQQSLEEARDRYADLYDFAPTGYISSDRQGVIQNINHTGAQMLDVNRDDVLGCPITALLAKGQSGKFFAHLRRVFANDRPQMTELEARGRGGKTLVLGIQSATATVDGQKICRLAFADVTDQHHAQNKLRLAAQVFATTLEGIVILDPDYRVSAVNPAFCRITGFGERDVIGKDLPSLPLLCGNNEEGGDGTIWKRLHLQGYWQGEITCHRKNGESFAAWGMINSHYNTNGRLINYVFVFSDITPIKQTQQHLKHMAHHDMLTGLPNRTYFQISLTQMLARAKRHEKRVAMFYIDLDHFKHINDSLGHAAGDHLLTAIAHRLRNFVRGEDLVARLGGDEFILVFDDIEQREDAATIAVKILDLLNSPVKLGGQEVIAGASIGISLYPDDADNAESLASTADTALYRAKHEGRNTFVYYTPELARNARFQLSMGQAIREGLTQDRFQLYYQPQLNLEQNRISGLECLLRWRNAHDEIVPAQYFIQVAEESGLIAELDEWAFRQVCAQIIQWRKLGLIPPPVSINLSPRTLHRPNLAASLKAIIDEFEVDAAWIEIEVTEHALQTSAKAHAELAALKALGVKVAIDDFGTGYSCLASLSTLPVDRLKVDRSFVANAMRGLNDSSIIQTIINIGHSLGLKIVGEGVETPEQQGLLRASGCDDI